MHTSWGARQDISIVDRAVGAVASALAGAVFVGLSVAHVGALSGFVLPVWAILAATGLVISNAPAVALSRHHDAAGTAAALLGAAQFGLGAAVAPLVGVVGNDEVALALVMTTGVVIALFALLSGSRPATMTTRSPSWLQLGAEARLVGTRVGP
jgi:MFS transporter, DHA1 family, multidrug resistance protein